MIAIHPYLTFDGNCEEAINFYAAVFNTKIEMMQRFSDMPADGGLSVTEEQMNQIMHASISLGENFRLMASDTGGNPGEVVQGNNFSISVDPGSMEETDHIFGQLSQGGTVTMPLDKTFWDSYFGMCVDKFGISWMVNCELSRA